MNTLSCVAALMTAAALCRADVSFYVATNGDDANPGTKDKPFATLERARDAVRQSKTDKSKAKVHVLVRAGTYELTKTFKLDAKDSGSETSPVVYCPYLKEKVLFIGGKRIAGFAPYKGLILQTNIGAQGFTSYFRQLFFDGKRMQLARYPNYDPLNPNGGFAYVDGPLPKDSDKYKEKPEYRPRQIYYNPTDARTWAHPEQAEVIYFPWHNWMNVCIPVASVDKEQRLITLTRDAKTHEGYPGGIRPGDRYYIRNLFEELDSPGEWFLDRDTRKLYFWPPKPLAGLTVYAPTTENMIEIGADAAWITIRGFTLECCDGFAVALRGANRCLVAANTIRNTAGGRIGGGGGVQVDGGFNCGVVGNDIYEVGNVGIVMRGGDQETLKPGGHIENNIIIDCDMRQFQMSGHDPKHSQWLIDKHKAKFAKYQHNPAYAKYPEVPALDAEKAWLMVGNKFCRNIICYRGTNSLLYTYSQDRCPEQNTTDYNMVWHYNQPITVQHSTGWKATKYSWEEWQKAGHDQHSAVADPLFANAAKDDYRLQHHSRAFQLGFKPIPVEKIGPYRSELRASWPIVEAEGVREHPLPIEMGGGWPDQVPVGDGTFDTAQPVITVRRPVSKCCHPEVERRKQVVSHAHVASNLSQPDTVRIECHAGLGQPANSRYLVTEDIVYGRQQSVPLPAEVRTKTA